MPQPLSSKNSNIPTKSSKRARSPPMRKFDIRDSSITSKAETSGKATHVARPQSALAGYTLWGSAVDGNAAPSTPSRPTSRCNHRQNDESTPKPLARNNQLTSASNHLQNRETNPPPLKRRAVESQINDGHMGDRNKLIEKDPKRKVTHSRINEGNIQFGASETKSAPPPRVEPFQSTPRRGHVRSVLPGFTDADKFGH